MFTANDSDQLQKVMYGVPEPQLGPYPGFYGEDRDTDDCGLYLMSLERHFKAHGIPISHWANELFLKLGGACQSMVRACIPRPQHVPFLEPADFGAAWSVWPPLRRG